MEARMALIEDMFKGSAVTGIAVGVAAAVLGPTLFPTIGRILRPAAKTVIKGGMMLYEQTVAGIGDLTSDLVAEARSELDGSRQEAPAVAGPGKSPSAQREGVREKH
jgi:hypothetical protein